MFCSLFVRILVSIAPILLDGRVVGVVSHLEDERVNAAHDLLFCVFHAIGPHKIGYKALSDRCKIDTASKCRFHVWLVESAV